MHRDASLSDVHFNPRSREGSDLTKGVFFVPFFNFNPRSREGSDNVYVL